MSGYVFMLNGGVVSWSAKSQEIVSLSMTENEYVAITHTSKEVLWLHLLLEQLFGPLAKPTILFSDNQSAIALTKDYQYHAQTKYIDTRFHFIHWIVKNGSIQLIYCPTANKVANAFMKPLLSAKAKHFASALGLSMA
jgi:hypothetical protein